MSYVLGIDSGLTVTKAAIFDTQGTQVAVAKRSVTQLMPEPYHVERDMDHLWVQTSAAIREALQISGLAARDIVAVSQTAHGDGLYLLDQARQPLGMGILSLDGRAQSVVDDWKANGTSARCLTLSGQMPHASAPSAILAWVKANDPARYAKIAHVLSCKDWLRFRLTAKIGTDRTEASTSFTNVQTQAYDPEICDVFALPEIAPALPRMHHSAEIAGHVTPKAAQETGLLAGTPVATGLHDVTASALGMGAHTPDCLAIVAGTYSINQIISEQPKISENWFCRNAIAPGLWNNMAISPASTTNYDWFVKTFCAFEAQEVERQGGSIHHVLAEEALKAGPSSICFHPYLFGSPFGSQANAGLLGLRGWHSRGDIIAAIFEGIVFNHRHHIDDLRDGLDVREVRLSGGISRNQAIPQLFADALGFPVSIAPVDETAAWGAALCAGASVDLFQDVSNASRTVASNSTLCSPSPDRQDALEHRYRVFRESALNLKPTWNRLNALSEPAK